MHVQVHVTGQLLYGHSRSQQRQCALQEIHCVSIRSESLLLDLKQWDKQWERRSGEERIK